MNNSTSEKQKRIEEARGKFIWALSKVEGAEIRANLHEAFTNFENEVC